MTIEEFKKQEIERMVDLGFTLQQMGDSLGITKQAISLWMKRNNYIIKSQWKKKTEA